MNTKQAMGQAKKYIQAKEYDKARAILAKIDHPTARKWEAKIDEITPKRSGALWGVLSLVLFGVFFVSLAFALLWWWSDDFDIILDPIVGISAAISIVALIGAYITRKMK